MKRKHPKIIRASRNRKDRIMREALNNVAGMIAADIDKEVIKMFKNETKTTTS